MSSVAVRWGAVSRLRPCGGRGVGDGGGGEGGRHGDGCGRWRRAAVAEKEEDIAAAGGCAMVVERNEFVVTRTKIITS